MMAHRYGDENFQSLSLHSELLRAPTRKRKPDNERPIRHRVVKMTWDMDTEHTAAMMDDVGVSVLDDMEEEDEVEEDEDENMQQNTPYIPMVADSLPPGAPKVTVLPNPQLQGNHSAFTSIQGISSLHAPPPYTNVTELQGLDAAFQFHLHRRPVREKIVPVKDMWQNLSDEIILSVFCWLPKSVLVRCARVCKRWYTLAMDETLWRRLDLGTKTVKKGVLGRVLDRGVLALRLAKTEIQTPLYSDSIAFNQRRVSRIQYLDLSMAVVNSEGLEQILATCHHLRKLSLENCTLTDNVLRSIGQNRNLEVLNLCMGQGITENGLVPICNNLQRLDALNIGWSNMSRGALLYLVICLPPSLTKLNLSGCRETLLDEDVQQLCRSCPNLKELDLSDSTVLTSQTITFIVSMLRGLEYIALSRCYHILPSALPLLGHIVTLLALDVFGMLKESALAQLREAMPAIRINKFPFSSIARPTTGIRRTSIWGLRVRDSCM